MSEERKFSKEENTYLELGYDYIKKEDWGRAIESFKKALEIDPDNVWANIEIGKLHRNKTDFLSAEEKFKEVLNMPIDLDKEQLEQAHVGLGEVYRIQGRYDLAVEEFQKALRANPANKKLSAWLERANGVDGHKRVPPYRIFFTWRIDYQCNYRCSYCLAPKPEKPCFEQEKRNQTLYLDLDEWINVWHNIYKKYGTCRIRLDGGEPSIYPSFIGLIAGVSQYHGLQINTNLSFDVLDFVKSADPKKVRVDASFHPEFVSFEDFFSKILILHEHKFKIVASCVAFTAFLDKIREYKRPFEDLHIPFIIHPLSGEFDGKSYPRDYETEDVSKIYSVDEASRLVMNWRKGENRTTKGKLCRMGQMYATIFPSGDVYRCCVNEQRSKIGNICEESFRLLDAPMVCESENCLCWKCMIINEEERWTSLWIDDWEMPL